MKFNHMPVMLKEVIESLGLRKGDTVVDATLGGGGHSMEILQHIGASGLLIGIDRDRQALEAARENLSDHANIELHNANFSDLDKVLKGRQVDAILADFGVSSHQIDTAERGFSYMLDGPLNMRMDGATKHTAWNVVNNFTEKDLERIIREYGEERYSKRIASNIVSARPIETTGELSKICVDSVPGSYFRTAGHPAKRTFQAIRIAVNDELGSIEKFLPSAINALKDDGRIAIITFHSLEDRIVKHMFKDANAECMCPPKTPQCICNHKRSLEILTKKPMIATDAEQRENPRSASAKLRVAQKI